MNIYHKIFTSATVLSVFWLFGVATSRALPVPTTVLFINESKNCTIQDFSFEYRDKEILSDTSNSTVKLKPTGSFAFEVQRVDTLIGVRYHCSCTDSDVKSGVRNFLIDRTKKNEIILNCP